MNMTLKHNRTPITNVNFFKCESSSNLDNNNNANMARNEIPLATNHSNSNMSIVYFSVRQSGDI